MDTNVSAPSIMDATPLATPELVHAKNERALKFLRASRLLSYLILACGLWTVTVGARQIITSHSLVPLWDEWQEIDAIVTAPHHSPPISWLWSLHNEHRIVFYRLLLLADVHLLHGRHWISFWSMLVVQLLFLVCLGAAVRFAGVSGTLWRAIIGLGAFALFCPSQWENFGWAFQISFLLPVFFAVLALSALLKYDCSVRQLAPKGKYVGLSIAVAIAATFSNANGIVLWPLLALVAIMFVPRRRIIFVYLGCGIVSIAFYLHHYAAPSIHSSPLDSIRHPLLILTYTAGYLGVIFPPWVRIRDLLAISSGAFGLLLALTLAIRALRRRRQPLHIVLFGFVFFTASTAFITALGRVGLGLEQAFSSRYQTFNLLFWFSVVSLALLAADEISSALRTIVLAAIAAAMLLAFAVFPLGLRASRTRTQQAEAASAALLAGVPDKSALGVLYIDPDLVWRDAEYFRQQGLFMFSDRKNSQMGQLLSSAYRIGSPRQCSGQASTVEVVRPEDLLFEPDAPAFRISGSAVLLPSNQPVRRFILSVDGRVVGFAASVAGPFLAKHSQLVRRSESRDWLGYARPPRRAALVDAYAVVPTDGTLCALATVALPQR